MIAERNAAAPKQDAADQTKAEMRTQYGADVAF